MLGSDFFDNQGPDPMSRIRAWEQKVEERYKGYMRAGVVRDEHFESVTRKSLDMSRLLNAMPKNERRRLIQEYEDIIGVSRFNRDNAARLVGATDQTLRDLGLGRMLIQKEADQKSPIRMAVDNDMLNGRNIDPLAFIWNRMTPQLSRETGKISLSANIMRADVIEDVLTAPAIRPGAKVLTLDTETAGLLETSGIRQASWSTSAYGDRLSMGDVSDRHFRTAQTQRGLIATKNGTVRMDDFLSGGKYANAVPGSGDDFVAGMRPLLEEMRDADFIAGQNIGFDLDHIFYGLRATRAYQENTDGFRVLLDEVTDATLGTGKVLDTLAMSRMKLPDVALSPELERLGKATTHSIENLLIQTNLFDLVKQEIAGTTDLSSVSNLDDLVSNTLGLSGSSLHSADVDTYVTQVLLKGLNEDRLQVGSFLGTSGVDQRLRESIRRSSAVTPVTKIADISHLDKKLFAQMLDAEDGLRFGDTNLSYASLKNMGVEAAYDHLTSKGIPVTTELTYAEQRMLLTRGDITTKVKPMDNWQGLFQFGNFREYAGMRRTGEGFLNRAGTLFKRGLRPSAEEFSNLQTRLADYGMPFADISEDERWLTHALSSAASRAKKANPLLRNITDPVERTLMDLTDDLGINRFMGYEHSFISKSGQTVNINPKLIQMAQESGEISTILPDIGDDVRMLDYSAYQLDDGRKGFNVRLKLSESEAGELADWMVQHQGDDAVRELFQETDLRNRGYIESVADAVRNIGHTRGVGIANLPHEAGAEAYDIVKSFNVGAVNDAAVIQMRAGFMGLDDSGVLRTGAWVSDRFATPEMRQNYAESMRLAKRRLEEVTSLGRHQSSILAMTSSLTDKASRETVQKTFRIYDKVAPKAPWAIAGAAVAGLGYYLNKRRQEKNSYRETLDVQDFEATTYGPMGIAQQGQVYAMRQGVDPLSTTGVNAIQYQSRIGHTNMGPNRNMHLFGQ